MSFNYQRSIPGVSFDQDNARISIWAPDVKKVSIHIKGKTDLPLQQEEFGYWTLITTDLKPGDRYKFVLDDQDPLPDPASRSQLHGVHGHSQALKLDGYQWTDQQWQNPSLGEYIMYELHTGTFTPDGTFDGIIKKLPYLKELGVTAIEIMPVAQFPGERNWGYDGVFPYAVQNSYGGAEGLMQLVDACHAEGLAVILDVVYNHLGPEGNYFSSYGPYFTEKYRTPWGNALNFDDAWCDAVRNYYVQNVLMWFRDFHIDALRMDAVHAIKDFSPKHILKEIKEEVDRYIATSGRDHYLIIEFDLNDKRFIDPLSKDGYGMDAQWLDEFHHALRVTAGGDRNGYYSDFEGIEHLAKAYSDAYVYNGIYSPERRKTFGTQTDNPGQQFVVFSQNHDHVGNRMLGERPTMLFSPQMNKLMAAAVLISPYLPMLFMGEEYGETNPFLYFVSHTDEELIEAVRKGRKEEFKAFHAAGEAPDPQAEDTFKRSALNWDAQHPDVLQFYKDLIALRKRMPALSNNNRQNMTVTADAEKQLLTLTRWEGISRVVCLLNFSSSERPLSAQEDGLSVIFRSEKVSGGDVIPPQSIIIYANENV